MNNANQFTPGTRVALTPEVKARLFWHRDARKNGVGVVLKEARPTQPAGSLTVRMQSGKSLPMVYFIPPEHLVRV